MLNANRTRLPRRSRSAFLDCLPDAQRKLLAALGREVSFAAGENLVTEGSPAPPVFIVHSGFVKVLRAAQSDSVPMIVDLCGAGDVIGVEDCLTERRSHAALVAAKSLVVLEIPQRAFRAYLADHPRAMATVAQILASRVRLRDMTLSFAAHKVGSRLTAFLARQQAIHGHRHKDSIVIDIGLNHADIAAAIGASAASVSSELVKLKNDGYIEIGYKTIHVKKQLRDDAPPV